MLCVHICHSSAANKFTIRKTASRIYRNKREKVLFLMFFQYSRAETTSTSTWNGTAAVANVPYATRKVTSRRLFFLFTFFVFPRFISVLTTFSEKAICVRIGRSYTCTTAKFVYFLHIYYLVDKFWGINILRTKGNAEPHRIIATRRKTNCVLAVSWVSCRKSHRLIQHSIATIANIKQTNISTDCKTSRLTMSQQKFHISFNWNVCFWFDLAAGAHGWNCFYRDIC